MSLVLESCVFDHSNKSAVIVILLVYKSLYICTLHVSSIFGTDNLIAGNYSVTLN